MIEKPKRPNKIPNQDNKQPQTIQELIRRYDLDNTKIYDFLDELISQINLDKTQSDKQVDQIKTKVEGTVLYEDEAGTTEDLTLSETSANFKKIEITYKYGDICSTIPITDPNGKKFSLGLGFSMEVYSLSRYQYKVILINETSITNEGSGYLGITENGTVGASSTENAIYITKVVGYR